MKRESQLIFCKVCKYRKFNPQQGLVCSLTNRPAEFESECKDFRKDEQEEKRLSNLKLSSEPIRNRRTIIDFKRSSGRVRSIVLLNIKHDFQQTLFHRIVFWCLLFNIPWIFICRFFESHMTVDHGLVTSAGFMVCYILTFLIPLPRDQHWQSNFSWLLFGIPLIFFVSTFIYTPLVGFYIKAVFPALLLIPILPVILLVLIIHKIYKIDYLILTIIAGILIIGIFQMIAFSFPRPDPTPFTFPALFASWQILSTVVIALGVTIMKSERDIDPIT